MPPHAKSSNPIRRVSSGLAKVSTHPTSSRINKAPKGSKIICLKLSSKALRRWAPNTPEKIPSPVSPTKQAPEIAPKGSASERDSKTVQVKAEASSPPEAAAASETPQSVPKDSLGKNTAKESTPKTGSKRALGTGVEGPKPRSRPGPKKKIKVYVLEAHSVTIVPHCSLLIVVAVTIPTAIMVDLLPNLPPHPSLPTN